MEAVGKVVRICDGLATVEIIRKGACGDHCAHCNGCNAEKMVVEADCRFDVAIGDWVRMSSENRPIFLGMFALFVLPCILPLIAYLLAMKSGFGGLAAVVALFISGVGIVCLNKSAWYQRKSRPQVIEITLKEKK